MLKNKSRNIKGITLIALVITIIVLLILAGITINMITSQDGILSKTILAKGKMNEAEIEEKIKLAVTKAQINENGLDKNELKDELNKYFGDKYTLTENSDGSCVIEVEGVIYKVDSSGNILNGKYELATSEDGTISDSSGDSLSNYIIYGNSKQNGEPSPENPVEIESVGDKTANLFDKNNAKLFNGYVNAGKLNAYNSNVKTTATFVIECKPNTTYTVSRQIIGKRFAVGTSSKEPGADIEMTNSKNDFNNSSITITSGENDIYLYVWFYNSSYDTEYTYQQLMDEIQVEEGSNFTQYEPYGYRIPVKVETDNSNKNLATAQQVYGGLVEKKGSASDPKYEELVKDNRNCIKFIDNAFVEYNKINFKENTQYTVSFDYKQEPTGIGNETKHDSYLFVFKYTDGTQSILWVKNENEESQWKHISFTSRENRTISSIGNLSYNYHFTNYIDVDTFQLEEGIKETEYKPYKKENTVNIYLSEPLRKVGDYADYIDFKNKKVVRKIKSITLNGDEDWSKYVSVDNHYQLLVNDNYFSKYDNNIFSNYYIKDKINKQYYSNMNYAVMSTDGYRIRFKDKDVSNVDEWKEKVKKFKENNIPLKVCYQLASQSEQTIELPNILAGKGNNKVTIETKIQPSKIELTYYKAK